jgi:hypothetical protein
MAAWLLGPFNAMVAEFASRSGSRTKRGEAAAPSGDKAGAAAPAK